MAAVAALQLHRREARLKDRIVEAVYDGVRFQERV